MLCLDEILASPKLISSGTLSRISSQTFLWVLLTGFLKVLPPVLTLRGWDDSFNFFNLSISFLINSLLLFLHSNVALKKIKSIKLNKRNVLNGIKNVIKNTNLIGRWQIAKTQPKVIYDVAHNIDSLELVFNQIKNTKGKIRIVFGTLDKTDQLDCLKIFPKKHEYYFCAPKTKRAMSLNKLCKKAKELKINFSSHSSVKKAYHTAFMNSKNDDTVLVTGSTYLFSEINN